MLSSFPLPAGEITFFLSALPPNNLQYTLDFWSLLLKYFSVPSLFKMIYNLIKCKQPE